MRNSDFPKPSLDSLQDPFGIPPDSLWHSSRINIHTVHKAWAGRLKSIQSNHTMNLLCENYEKTMNSRISLWISPKSVWNFPRLRLEFTSHLYSYCAQNLRWTPQAFPTQAYYELTMRKL